MNKPFDRLLKSFAEDLLRLLPRQIGLVPPGTSFAVTALPVETAPSVVVADHVVRLDIEGQPPVIFHQEYQTWFRQAALGNLARKGGSLAAQYQIPVVSVLVLLKRDGVPEELPGFAEFAVGETRTLHPFHAIRLWELDPAPILETGEHRLLPLAVLMKSTNEQVLQIARALAKSGDEETRAHLIMAGALRYHKDALVQLKRESEMTIYEAFREGNWLIREWDEKWDAMEAKTVAMEAKSAAMEAKTVAMEAKSAAMEAKSAAMEARARLAEQALVRSRADEARQVLRRALGQRCPGLETIPELDAISRPETLHALLFDHVLAHGDRDHVRLAITTAAAEQAQSE